MNYSPLGSSYPDLTVVGAGPPVAAYGQPITVSADLVNLGSSTVIEPTNLSTGNPGTSGAPASTIGVYLSRNPRHLTGSSIKLGDIVAPPVGQAGVVEVTGTFLMPSRPRGYPANGGNVYLFFRANDGNEVFQLNRRNDVSRAPQAVQLAAPLPQLEAIAINVPPVMQAGDAISAEAKIANYGTADTNLQAPVVVELVASTDRNFGPGDVVLAAVSISNIPPLSAAPAPQTVLGDTTLDDPVNVVTVQFPSVLLPSSPGTYYLGLEIDPNNQIHEISEVGRGQGFALQQVATVGPRVTNLPPAGVVSTPASPLQEFAIPAYGRLTAPYLPASQLPGVLIGMTTVPTAPTTPTSGDTGTGSTSGSSGAVTSAYVVPGGPVNQAGGRAGRWAAFLARRRGG